MPFTDMLKRQIFRWFSVNEEALIKKEQQAGLNLFHLLLINNAQFIDEYSVAGAWLIIRLC